MRFRATVEQGGKTATGIHVPDEALTYSNKRRHVMAVDGAKTAQTRARRIAKAVDTLRDGA